MLLTIAATIGIMPKKAVAIKPFPVLTFVQKLSIADIDSSHFKSVHSAISIE